jgi:hypothetical protein
VRATSLLAKSGEIETPTSSWVGLVMYIPIRFRTEKVPWREG